ncbi:hypothetical protein [Mesobacillus selenatarsenatis]|uniref:Uncharacterized protein n=1 Tax=Mesobacillus selenatarsenatis (strain DSM 18680 / JCM 14380 / FERM P-15431 / SF-1) TaxID=1321606 RepID=A0A0A8X3A8_MESS1|nr:hypothetical protein [Mesobacillus selenatarsenatis]GAM13517.1 hypothetical protein SAMD00020551_1662 [Mesobacillus selenatarsenatis SF-1]
MKKRHKIEIPVEESSSHELMESSSSSANSPDDDFCFPDDCPERIETLKIPSPTSCMPEGQLYELEEKIDGANRMLLDLGLSNEQSELGRRILFDGLAGQMVKIKINCSDHEESNTEASPADPIEEVINKKTERKKCYKKKRLAKKKRKHRYKKKKLGKNFLKGYVQLVGSDFVQLQKNRKTFIIPFNKICLVLSKKPYHPPRSHAPLLDIDPCFRRDLTFNFGETVAHDPELIQIFFRIKLSMYLKTFTDEKVIIYTNSEKVIGLLAGLENGNVNLVSENGQIKEIPFTSFCYLKKA